MKVRMVKTLLWSLNGLLTVAILGSVALFLLKSRAVQADRLSDLDAIAREAQSKARRGPAKSTKGFEEFKAIWDLNIRDIPPVEVPVSEGPKAVPKTTPLEEVIALRAIIGQSIMVEYKGRKDALNPALQLQRRIDLGQEIPEVTPTATVAEILPDPEPERVKFQYDGKEVTLSIKRDLDPTTRNILGGPGGKKPKNAPAGEGELIESEDDQPFAPAGGLAPTGRKPGEEIVTETKEIKPGVWQISAEERDKIRDTAKDLLDQAEVSTYTNEKTHKNEGMIVDHIQSDSLLAQRGLNEGDVIKSINGQAVSSKTELINYVKDNQDRLTVVRVEILRHGKPMTLEYRIPK